MALGMTRREQWVLLGTIGVIAGAMAIHGWRGRDRPNLIDVEGQGRWQRLGTVRDGQVEWDGESTPAPPANDAALVSEASASAAVDINTADAAMLADRLPGIGPARAAAILTTRQRLGGFKTVDDLLEVRGISPATLDAVRPFVTVGGAAAPSPTPTEAETASSVGDGLVAPPPDWMQPPAEATPATPNP